MKLTVAIPTHAMEGREFFLRRNLDSLWNQSFQDFEIVVTDNSDDDMIEEICRYYGGIKYYRNPVKGMAQNTNEAIRRSEGELIKILYLDDYLAHENSLQAIVDCFDGQWLVTGCKHFVRGEEVNPHIPRYSIDIKHGINTIGSPSVMTIKNDHPLMFDENMTWLLDADYYARMYKLYGSPVILEDMNVIIGLGDHQMTHILTDELKANEHDYLNKKYE